MLGYARSREAHEEPGSFANAVFQWLAKSFGLALLPYVAKLIAAMRDSEPRPHGRGLMFYSSALLNTHGSRYES